MNAWEDFVHWEKVLIKLLNMGLSPYTIESCVPLQTVVAGNSHSCHIKGRETEGTSGDSGKDNTVLATDLIW